MMDRKFRLIEYVATIGIDETLRESINQMNGDLSSFTTTSTTTNKFPLEGGCVLNRFPLEDHQDFPFPAGIENFCLPNGWYLETKPKRPVFYSVVLTNVDGLYSFAAYIVWNQCIGKYNNNGIETDDIYAPKCICVVSRLPYFVKFKECLLTLFDGLWNQNKLDKSKDTFLTEKVVSALISSPQIFEPGLEPYQLTLYDKYYINVSPPLTTQFNTTGDDVFFLAKHLGVHNLIRLYSVLLLDNKILFVSSSYNFLFKACNGLVSLLYPLKFNYVYIPLLPKSLTDIVNAPTPFMIGMHASSFETFNTETPLATDVVVVNLDTGSVQVNPDHHVPFLSGDMTNFLEEGISNILFPELYLPDELFCKPKEMSEEAKDKKIRAYFLILLMQMFQGYLSCSNVVRVHPKTLIKFQKDQFLYRRNLCSCPFAMKFFDTMIFGQFISERGVPYRLCDIFDDLMMRYNNEVAENKEKTCLTPFINTAWSTFMENERVDEVAGTSQPSHIPKIGMYEESNFSKLNVRDIDANRITFNATDPDPQQLVYSTNSLAKMARSPGFIPLDINSYRFGLSFSITTIASKILKEFVRYIFEGECPRALQMIKKIQALGVQQPGIRVLLCNELNAKIKQNCNQLDCEQFKILCDVINSYLNCENDNYCFTMSSLVVELANNFYKKNKDNMVFIYTQLHNHRAWGFLPFWESVFYVSAQTQLNFLYLHDKTLASIQSEQFSEKNFSSYFANENKTKEDSATQETVFHSSYHDISRVPPVIVDQLMKFSGISSTENLEVVEKLEDDILFSTLSLFISQILYMNMQMKEASRYIRSIQSNKSADTNDRAGCVDSNKAGGSVGGVSAAARNDNRLGSNNKLNDYKSICELIQRFIANVIVTLDFKFEVSSQINARMLEIMKFHCEALDRIYHEKDVQLKDINDIVKVPLNIPGETVVASFSCVLFPEGSVNDIHLTSHNSPAILPAIGIVFVTQYRLQFFGYPINRYTCNQIVAMSIPFGLIRSNKPAESGYFPSIYQKKINITQLILLQLKSGGRVIFGLLPENGSDKIDLFSKLLNKRYCRLLAKLTQNENIAIEASDSVSSAAPAAAVTAVAATATGIDNSSEKVDSVGGASQSRLSTTTIHNMDDVINHRDSIVSTFEIDHDLEGIVVPAGTADAEAEGEAAAESFQEDPTAAAVASSSSNKVSKMNFLKNNMKSKLKGLKQSATKKIKATTTILESKGGATGSKSSKFKTKQKVLTTDFKAFYVKLFEGDENNKETVTNKLADKSLFICDYGRRMQILVYDCTLASNLFCKIDWRLTLMNTTRVISTLPSIFPVCFQITDDAIMRLSKMFKLKRIPVLTWTRTKPTTATTTTTPANTNSCVNYYPGALLRCGSVLKSLNVFALKAVGAPNNNSKPNNSNGLSELDNYFITLAALSSKAKIMQQSTDTMEISHADSMYMDLLDRLRRPHMLFISDTQEAYDVNDVSCHFSDLYIYGDKSFNKGISEDKKLTIFNIEMPDAHQLETSFLKFTKGLSPNKPEDLTQSSYMTLISKSRWLVYIKKIIELSTNLMFSIDYGESFSVAGFGDGSETSAQVSSVVQILLDPYYRTIDGFQTLIEKEWLAFKYNFVLRNGITSGSQSVFFPIFLQFIDCVHQLLLQFPNAFEFNDYFLKFVAYHHLSNKFSTFLTCSTDSFTTETPIETSDNGSLDLYSAKSSEEVSPTIPHQKKSLEISDNSMGVIIDEGDEKLGSDKNDYKVPTANATRDETFNANESIDEVSSQVPITVTSSANNNIRGSMSSLPADNDDYFMKETIWSYINRYREKIPIFYNTQYIQGFNSVLYPNYHLASIDLWEYYYEIPQMMTPSTYELEYIDRNLFVDSNAVFPYELYCSNNSSLGCYSTRNSDVDAAVAERLSEKNFTFYSGASYLGYVISGPLAVDQFNLIINNYLKNNKHENSAKVNSMLSFANVYVMDKLPQLYNAGTPHEKKTYELVHSNYFPIVNTKRYFISLVSKDKSFYSKTTVTDADPYFCQVTHDFVEAPPSEHLPCIYCSKILSGKCNYYTCQKCQLNIHIKCSKQISQICNMGEGEPNVTNIASSDTANTKTITKSYAKKYQLLTRDKVKTNINDSSNETDTNTDQLRKNKRSSMDSYHRWSALSTTCESGQLTYPTSTTQYQGYLYKDNEQCDSNKQYYVIDTKEQKLLQYDKKPSLQNSVLLDEWNFSHIERCVLLKSNASSPDEVKDDNTAAPNQESSSPHMALDIPQPCTTIYLEIKFSFSDQPLHLRAKNDDITSSWYVPLFKATQH